MAKTYNMYSSWNPNKYEKDKDEKKSEFTVPESSLGEQGYYETRNLKKELVVTGKKNEKRGDASPRTGAGVNAAGTKPDGDASGTVAGTVAGTVEGAVGANAPTVDNPYGTAPIKANETVNSIVNNATSNIPKINDTKTVNQGTVASAGTYDSGNIQNEKPVKKNVNWAVNVKKPEVATTAVKSDIPQENLELAQRAAQGAVSPDQGSQEEMGWNESLFRAMNERNQLSEEELKKQRRREKAQKVIAGLGDIAAAAINMGFAAKGATPVNTTNVPTLSDRYQKKWSDWYNDYKAQQDKYTTGLENARKLDFNERKANRQYELNLAKEERLQEDYRAKDEKRQIESEILRLKYQSIQEQAPEQKALIENRVKELEQRMQIRDEEHQKKMAQYDANIARLNRSGYGSGSRGKGKAYATFDGNTYYSAQDYENAVRAEARRLGISDWEEVSTTNALGLTDSKTVLKRPSQLVQDINAKRANKQ